MGEIHEKCAVVGVFDPEAAELTAQALRKLEHRGPDSTGIGGITESGQLDAFRAAGTATEVLTADTVGRISALGMVATVGHGRYATSGGADKFHPINGGNRILYAKNGNASDLSLLEADLQRRGLSTSAWNDSEMNTWAIADRIKRGASTVEAIADAYPLMVGAFSSVLVGKGLDGEPMLAAWRDEHGVRPLAWGYTRNGGVMFASETAGLDAAGASYEGDVPPGGLMTVSDNNAIQHYRLATPNPKFDPFEIIYFSNKNSLFMGHRIGDLRFALGQMAAAEFGAEFGGDSVIAVPNSARPYAQGYGDATDLEYDRDAITKNPNIGERRSFMESTREAREKLRDIKYLFDVTRIDGRNPIVVDDSLVRNNTAPHVSRQMREAGAESVNFVIGSPPIRYPNYYGIATPEQRDLVAATMSIEQIREKIGCDRLGYLSLRGMLDVFQEITGEPSDHFELSCFTGEYPIPIGQRNIRRPAYAGNVA